MNRILLNKQTFTESFKTAFGIIFALVSFILLFFSIEDLHIDTIWKKCIALIVPVVLSLMFAVCSVYTYKKKVVLNETQRTISLIYGDLWRYGFPKFDLFCKKNRIVVVNVNTTFDTIVDPPGVNKALVSSKTVHGQWLNQMIKSGVTVETIDSMIKKSLGEQGVYPISKLSKKRGNCDNYPKGTIASCRHKNTIFYLIALSEFDENNNAQNTLEELRITILKLIEFIDKNSQNADIYIPLMGSGISRTGIDDATALEVLKSNLKIYKEKLHGNVNIVVYKGSRDTISLEG